MDDHHETTTILKLEPSTFRLYSIYPYDAPTPDPEIAFEKDHVKKTPNIITRFVVLEHPISNNHTKFGCDTPSDFGVLEVGINESTFLITRYPLVQRITRNHIYSNFKMVF